MILLIYALTDMANGMRAKGEDIVNGREGRGLSWEKVENGINGRKRGMWWMGEKGYDVINEREER